MTDTATHTVPGPEPTAAKERGLWMLEPHRIVHPEINGMTRTEIPIGARNSVGADLSARLAVYPVPEDLNERLAALVGQPKSTVLYHGENYFGSPYVNIRQGRLFTTDNGFAILPLGRRTNGYRVTGALDVIDATAKDPVKDLWRRWYSETGLPPTLPVTREALMGASQRHPVAVLWTHPGFGGGAVPGCVWYVTQVANEIANGYLYCPPSELESEHGSIEIGHLLREGALVCSEPQASFEQVFDLPSEARDAYRVLFGA